MSLVKDESSRLHIETQLKAESLMDQPDILIVLNVPLY